MRSPNTAPVGDAVYVETEAYRAARATDVRAFALLALRVGLGFVVGSPVVAFVEGYSVAIACMVAPFASAALAFVARKVAA